METLAFCGQQTKIRFITLTQRKYRTHKQKRKKNVFSKSTWNRAERMKGQWTMYVHIKINKITMQTTIYDAVYTQSVFFLCFLLFRLLHFMCIGALCWWFPFDADVSFLHFQIHFSAVCTYFLEPYEWVRAMLVVWIFVKVLGCDIFVHRFCSDSLVEWFIDSYGLASPRIKQNYHLKNSNRKPSY